MKVCRLHRKNNRLARARKTPNSSRTPHIHKSNMPLLLVEICDLAFDIRKKFRKGLALVCCPYSLLGTS